MVRSSGSPALRDTARVLGLLLVLGLLCGVLWSLVVTPAQFTKLATGGSMGEDQLGLMFAADGWYVAIALVAGTVAGFGLSRWRVSDALRTSVLLVLGSAVAAAAMAGTGHLLGPGDPKTALDAARLGARVPDQLTVDTVVVYLAWPVGVLLGALFVLLGRTQQTEPEARAEPAEVVTPAASRG